MVRRIHVMRVLFPLLVACTVLPCRGVAQIPGTKDSKESYPDLDELLETAKSDEAEVAAKAVQSLVAALEDEAWGRRIAAAKLLGECAANDVVVSALDEAIDDVRRDLKKAFENCWAKSRMKPVTASSFKEGLMSQEEVARVTNVAPYAAALCRSLGATRHPEANKILRDVLKRSKPNKSQFIVTSAACESLCEHGTFDSLASVISAYKAMERFCDRGEDKPPFPQARSGTLGWAFAVVNRPVQSKDLKTIHDALAAAFTKARVSELPEFRSGKSTAGAWKSLLHKHRKGFATEL